MFHSVDLWNAKLRCPLDVSVLGTVCLLRRRRSSPLVGGNLYSAVDYTEQIKCADALSSRLDVRESAADRRIGNPGARVAPANMLTSTDY